MTNPAKCYNTTPVMNDTPESDEVFGPRVTGVRARKCRDLERRLTIARETLSAINNAEILRPDIHAEISRILKATAP